MTTTRNLMMGLAGLALAATAACSGGSSSSDGAAPSSASDAPTALSKPGPGLSRVILLGDSVAQDEGIAMSSAFGAADIEFSSMASDGGGNVVGPFADKQWKDRTALLTTAKPSTVIYQITTYDWGTEAEQLAGYQRLADEVDDVGAKLVFVTVPPIKADEFYEPHLAELERTSVVAKKVADASDGQTVVLDANEVWGDTYERMRDGKVDRSTDGIHPCPQGVARFTSWILGELAELNPSFDPPRAKDWANTGWADDERFKGC